MHAGRMRREAEVVAHAWRMLKENGHRKQQLRPKYKASTVAKLVERSVPEEEMLNVVVMHAWRILREAEVKTYARGILKENGQQKQQLRPRYKASSVAKLVERSVSVPEEEMVNVVVMHAR